MSEWNRILILLERIFEHLEEIKFRQLEEHKMDAAIQAQLDRAATAITAIETKIANGAQDAAAADAATSAALEPVVAKLETDAS